MALIGIQVWQGRAYEIGGDTAIVTVATLGGGMFDAEVTLVGVWVP